MPSKKTVLLLALMFAAITALAGAVWVKTRPAKSYADMDAFSAAWKACPEEDRHEMLDWLLGQEPARHTLYPANQTRLSGMSRDEVIRYLGPSDSTVKDFYDVGTIEDDFFGNLVIKKWDVLLIEYDENNIVLSVETIS